METRIDKSCEHRVVGLFPRLNYDADDVDIPTDDPSISNLDIFFLISSIFMHIIDMAFDINVAVRYLLANKVTYFAWTVSFILLPSLINVIISKRMQHQDQQLRATSGQPEDAKSTQLMAKRKVCCVIATAFQLAPVIHYYDTLKYALKSRTCAKLGDRHGQRRYYIKMLKEDQDVALLRLFECFLEAAPQQVLQITILLKIYHASVNFEFLHQVGSIVSSLVSMGWAMASYNRSIRLAQQDRSNISIMGSVLQFIWHFGVTVSRILSVSVVASIWPLYMAIGCLCHWIGMSGWIIIDSHGMLEFCRNPKHAPHTSPTCQEQTWSVLFSSIIGIVHIFIYLNVVDGRTYLKHIFFYILCFFENITATVFWIFASTGEVKNAWYYTPLVVLCIVPFLLGAVAMILYYAVFHPSKRNKNSSTILSQIR